MINNTHLIFFNNLYIIYYHFLQGYVGIVVIGDLSLFLLRV
ncbi:hypothetical protein GFV14_00743 [Candidatus Hartigia pinicola]|nr:hypothetical protein GFV14_00743 [Candidatus Hartigia pinicola]